MADSNVVIISGKLPEAPKRLGTSEKGPVVMRVSVGERRKDKESGEFKTFYNSLDVVVWGDDRAACLSLPAGSHVAVTGQIRRESYEKNGEKVWQTRIKANDGGVMVQIGGGVEEETSAEAEASSW